jgi:hypothetical protein
VTAIAYTTPPTVGAFMDSGAFVRVIVGPIGSGKSSGCIMEILRRAMEQAPCEGVRRTRFAVIRNTYRQLKDTTRKTFEQWIPPNLGRWREQDFTFEVDRRLPDGTRMFCEVLFRALDRPQDVKKVLSLELTGAYFNELREVPKELFDGVQGRVGRYPSKAQGGPTWFGVWGDTNPWHTGHWGYELFSKGERPEGFELFEQPSGLGDGAENVENLPPGYYARLCAGKDSEWVDEYVRGKYPSSDKGSIYGALLDALEKRGGIAGFDHPSDGVSASFDLGVSDATAIWWWRIGKDGVPDLVDWYEATGASAAHYFDVLKERGYRYERIWLPHDARARTFQTGVSTLDLFSREFPGKVGITPELGLEDGISSARWLLEQSIRFHERCRDGLKRLRNYRFEWDEDRKVFSRKPLHDWTSHTADAFRYVAAVAKATEAMTRKEAPKPRVARVEPVAVTLGDPWEIQPNTRQERI